MFTNVIILGRTCHAQSQGSREHAQKEGTYSEAAQAAEET